MIDLTGFKDGDLTFVNTQVIQAANIITTQLGDLEYAPDLGIDLAYFLQEGVSFQNSSFKSHLIQTLAQSGINALDVQELNETLQSLYNINLGPQPQAAGLISR